MNKILTTLLLLTAIVMSGCVIAHVDYSVDDVEPIKASPYKNDTVYLKRLADHRYKDKKSVSSKCYNTGRYQEGISFERSLTDFNEVFADAKETDEQRYYIAPDRLYWNPYGPLVDLRLCLEKHINKAEVFRMITTDEDKLKETKYTLEIEVKRFLTLKGRRPFADGLGFLGTSALFSSDEIIIADIVWKLTDNKTKALVRSGTVSIYDVERHNNYRAKNKPFKLANKLARRLGEKLIPLLAGK